MKLERSLPYFNALLKANTSSRMSILRAFPKFVIDDLLEVLLNIVMGRTDLTTKNQHVRKHKKALLDIAKTKGKAKSRPYLRRIIYKQGGGFLPALIPLVMSIIAGKVGTS